ncbi:MAG TPA: DUF3099 domain-containing protein [Pseudonocardiaceae bacterium]|nr:DUF3099 domain-containing protein [Pseudonocardiaceae bacterium]
MSVQPPLITDAAPSFDEQQAHRRRTYSILMVVHIVGFALSYPLYLWQPWAGVAAIALTGVLPWVAVLLANGSWIRAVGRGTAGQDRRPRACYDEDWTAGDRRPARDAHPRGGAPGAA